MIVRRLYVLLLVATATVTFGAMPVVARETPEHDEFDAECGNETEIGCEMEEVVDGPTMPGLLIQVGNGDHWSLGGKSGGSEHGSDWGCYYLATSEEPLPYDRISHIDPTPVSTNKYSGHIMPSSVTSCTDHNSS